MIETDLFEFAYVPDWYGQLEQLAEMALPEAWRFRKPQTECKNTDTPILERYLHMIFRKLSIDYNTGETEYFHVENNCACFHTGLYTRQYQAIYACFERNKKKDTTLKWYFTGFCVPSFPAYRNHNLPPSKRLSAPSVHSVSSVSLTFCPNRYLMKHLHPTARTAPSFSDNLLP